MITMSLRQSKHNSPGRAPFSCCQNQAKAGGKNRTPKLKSDCIDCKHFLRRLFLYIIGMFFLAVGVGLAVKSDLGISPVNSIPYVVSRLTDFEQGNLTTVFFCLLIALQILLLRKEFQIIQLFQIACAFVFGRFVTICNLLFQNIEPHGYFMRILLLFLSVFAISLGMVLYLSANFIPQPSEGLCLAIQQKSGWKYSNIKTCFDCILVALAALISFQLSGHIVGLREGTVITMISVGKMIGVISSLTFKQLSNFCGTDTPVKR